MDDDDLDRMMAEAEEREAKARSTFDKFDVDKSGSIDEKELKNLIVDMGFAQHIPSDQLDIVVKMEMQKADTNKNGSISFEEFIPYFNSMRNLERIKSGEVESISNSVAAAKSSASAPAPEPAPAGEATPREELMAPAPNPAAAPAQATAGDYGNLNKDVRDSYEEQLLKWVKGLDGLDTSDYSQGFSGTKTDTIIENSINMLLRGGTMQGDTTVEEGSSGAPPCPASSGGRWLRTLNKQETCYLYVHTVTHVISGTKPDDFFDPEEERRRALKVLMGDFPDVDSCAIAEILEKTDSIHAQKKHPLFLTCNEDTHQALNEWFSEDIVLAEGEKFPPGVKPPVPKGYVINTRPLIWGQTRTGIKFEDAVETLRKQLVNVVKKGSCAVFDLGDQPPNFVEKVCDIPKYRDKLPVQLFDPMAQAWKKELLKGGRPAEKSRVIFTSFCDPKDYERALKENLDPVPWKYLHPCVVKGGALMDIVTMRSLPDACRGCALDKRTPLIIDATQQRNMVDMYFKYERACCIEANSMYMKQLAAKSDIQKSPEDYLDVWESWRKQLVNAMKQGYYLVVILQDQAPDFVNDFCHPDYFPVEIFSHGDFCELSGEKDLTHGREGMPDTYAQLHVHTGSVVTNRKQEWIDKVVREEDKEAGVFVVRDGFQVVVTSVCQMESYAKFLRHSVPLKKMKVLFVME